MNTYNSDGYILIDLKEADIALTTQHISGLYNRVAEEVAKVNKLAIVINAGNLILPATTLENSCYASMFNGCEALTAITCLGETGLDQEYSGPCENWVYNVAASGTFTKSSNATWTTGDSGIPSGWTTQNAE